MDFNEAINFIDASFNHERFLNKAYISDFSLETMTRALAQLNQPQQFLKCIHIAGSKGKGSIAAFISSILKSAGYKVGLYTSPHLFQITERIRILSSSSLKNNAGLYGDEIAPDDFAVILTDIVSRLPVNIQKNLTYFEWLTLIAFCYFKEQAVDYVVLETGLGGRLDATNVVDSRVSVITPIGLEHTQILGTTLGEIAAEKSAIIKTTNQGVVIAPQKPEASTVIETQIKKVGVKNVWRVDQDCCWRIKERSRNFQIFDVEMPFRKYANFKSHLLGDCQVINAATALSVVESLQEQGLKISESAIRQGIEEVFWPGRFEIMTLLQNKLQCQVWILDCSHTVESVEECVKTFQQIFLSRKATIIFGVSEDKDRAQIIQRLKDISAQWIITQAQHPRSHIFKEEELRSLLVNQKFCQLSSVVEAVQYAQEKSTGDIILVVGSIFVMAEAREILKRKKV